MGWEQKIAAHCRHSCESKTNDFCRVIVEISGENNDQIKSVVKANHGKIFREIKLIPSLVIEIPRFALPELARLDQVKKITNDPQVRHCDHQVYDWR